MRTRRITCLPETISPFSRVPSATVISSRTSLRKASVITQPTTKAIARDAAMRATTISPPRMFPVYTKDRMLAEGATQSTMKATPMAAPL